MVNSLATALSYANTSQMCSAKFNSVALDCIQVIVSYQVSVTLKAFLVFLWNLDLCKSLENI